MGSRLTQPNATDHADQIGSDESISQPLLPTTTTTAAAGTYIFMRRFCIRTIPIFDRHNLVDTLVTSADDLGKFV